MPVYDTMALLFLFSFPVKSTNWKVWSRLGQCAEIKSLGGGKKHWTTQRQYGWGGGDDFYYKKWRGKDFSKGKDDGANTSHQEESDSKMGNFELRKKSWPLHIFLWIKWQPCLFLLKKFRPLFFWEKSLNSYCWEQALQEYFHNIFHWDYTYLSKKKSFHGKSLCPVISLSWKLLASRFSSVKLLAPPIRMPLMRDVKFWSLPKTFNVINLYTILMKCISKYTVRFRIQGQGLIP